MSFMRVVSIALVLVLNSLLMVQPTAAQPKFTNLETWPDYIGPDLVTQALSNGEAAPRSLATADFDRDGVPDLLLGYRLADGSGAVAWQRGNLDMIFPNHPAARKHRREGTLTEAPFLQPARVLALPRAADFLATGDFDADGYFDLVAAARNDNMLVWLAGDGNGGFDAVRQLPLTGTITALATGEVNRQDGLADLAVSVTSSAGSSLQVFEGPGGALRSEPEIFPLSGPAMALALGRFDGDHFFDIAVASGHELQAISGRDRKLSWPRKVREAVEPSQIEKITLPFAVAGMVIDNTVGDLRSELALQTGTGKAVFLHIDTEDESGKPLLRLQSLEGELFPLTYQDERWALPTTAKAMFPVDGHTASEPVLPVTARFGSQASRDLVAPESVDGFEDPVAVLPARLNADGLSDLVVLTGDSRRIGFVLTKANATYTVNATNDLDDGVCDITHCSLHEAIDAANASPGADVIEFDIGGGGVQTITPAGTLPTITETLTLDGTSQPGFAGSPLIEISGAVAGLISGVKINLAAAGSLVRSLVVRDYQQFGISADAPDTLVEGSFVGTDSTGLAAAPNGRGIGLGAGCTDCRIGGTTIAARNLISGNLSHGIEVVSSNESSSTFGNLIGTTKDGNAPLGNSFGVSLFGVAAIIGGPSPGAGNVISGNNERGIHTLATGTLIQGNMIGLDATGTIGVLNGDFGLTLHGGSALVGGTSSAMANVISANGNWGIDVTSPPGNQIQGNYVGTNPSGDVLSNGGYGIAVRANNALVGGTGPGAGNVFAFNNIHGLGRFALNACSLQNTFRSNTSGAISGSAQARPILTQVEGDGTSVIIAGTQTGTPNKTYRIEFFANSTCHTSGFGEGEKYLGFTEVITDGTGEASFNITLNAAVAVGELVTATGSLLGDVFDCETSTFSLCHVVEALPDPTAPELIIPTAVPATPGFPVTVPVDFQGNGQDIAATTFSIDFDHTCLNFDPTDGNGDGIPDAVSILTPSAFVAGVSYDGTDTDGELDIAISDSTLPFSTLSNGTLLTVTFTPTCDPLGGANIIAPVAFSTDPVASWGDTSGESVTGMVTNGSVEIFSGDRGDCNGDGLVDAGDLTALTLELFDGDGSFWLDVSGGTFGGNPVGCDANGDTMVDAGDTACTTLLIFGGSCSSPVSSLGGIPQLHVSSSASDDSSIVVSVEIDSGGYDLSALVFSLDLAPGLVLDPTDANGDGIPDAVTIHASSNQRMVVFDPTDEDGELDLLLNDLNPAPTAFDDGVLMEIELMVNTLGGMQFSSEPSGSFGSMTGWSINGAMTVRGLFSDGFESGDLTAWSQSQP